MPNENTRVTNVTSQELQDIREKTPYVLPDRPTDSGYTASQIKGYYYKGMVDENGSIIATMRRIVDEINAILGEIDDGTYEVARASYSVEAFKDHEGNIFKDVYVKKDITDALRQDITELQNSPILTEAEEKTVGGETYEYLKIASKKVQVESAIQDEDGVNIKTNYAKKNEIVSLDTAMPVTPTNTKAPSTKLLSDTIEEEKIISEILARKYVLDVTATFNTSHNAKYYKPDGTFLGYGDTDSEEMNYLRNRQVGNSIFATTSDTIPNTAKTIITRLDQTRNIFVLFYVEMSTIGETHYVDGLEIAVYGGNVQYPSRHYENYELRKYAPSVDLSAYRTSQQQDVIDSALDDRLDTLEAKTTAIYIPKGSVPNYASLPTNVTVSGWVYNCIDTGDNYASVYENNTLTWDKLGGDIDLSNYYTKTQAENKFVEKVSGKGLSTNDYDATEKNKVSESYNAKHSHSNKSVLDNITSEKTTSWDNKPTITWRQF